MPVFTNSQQVTLVLQSLLLGVGIGAVYDMLRACLLYTSTCSITQYYHETGNGDIPSEGATSYGYENAGFSG